MQGVEHPQICAPGTAFDPTDGRCVLEADAACNSDTCSQIEGGTGLAASTESCEMYNYCFEGVTIDQGQCQPGLAFDSVTNRCMRREEATCFPGTSLTRVHVPAAPIAGA